MKLIHCLGMLIWSIFPKICLGHSSLFHDSNLSNLIELVDVETNLIDNAQYHELICYFENLKDEIIQHLITILKIKMVIHSMKNVLKQTFFRLVKEVKSLDHGSEDIGCSSRFL